MPKLILSVQRHWDTKARKECYMERKIQANIPDENNAKFSLKHKQTEFRIERIIHQDQGGIIHGMQK